MKDIFSFKDEDVKNGDIVSIFSEIESSISSQENQEELIFQVLLGYEDKKQWIIYQELVNIASKIIDNKLRFTKILLDFIILNEDIPVGVVEILVEIVSDFSSENGIEIRDRMVSLIKLTEKYYYIDVWVARKLFAIIENTIGEVDIDNFKRDYPRLMDWNS